MIGVGITAETVAEEFEAVGNRGDARGFGDGLRGRSNVCGGIDGAGDAAAAALNGGGDSAEDERGNEEGTAGGIGGDFIAVGEQDGDARSEAAGDIEYGQGGALAADEFARQKEYARSGRGRGLLSGGGAGVAEKKEGQSQQRVGRATQMDAHKEIVVEFGTAKKRGVGSAEKRGSSRSSKGLKRTPDFSLARMSELKGYDPWDPLPWQPGTLDSSQLLTGILVMES